MNSGAKVRLYHKALCRGELSKGNKVRTEIGREKQQKKKMGPEWEIIFVSFQIVFNNYP